MNHVKILKGQPRQFALSELVQAWYKTCPPYHFGRVEINYRCSRSSYGVACCFLCQQTRILPMGFMISTVMYHVINENPAAKLDFFRNNFSSDQPRVGPFAVSSRKAAHRAYSQVCNSAGPWPPVMHQKKTIHPLDTLEFGHWIHRSWICTNASSMRRCFQTPESSTTCTSACTSASARTWLPLIMCGVSARRRAYRIALQDRVLLTATDCNTHCNTHCKTHCNTHCNTDCITLQHP